LGRARTEQPAARTDNRQTAVIRSMKLLKVVEK
jgi:hypothetical protein